MPLNVNATEMLPDIATLSDPVADVVNAKLDVPFIAPGAPPDNVPDSVKAGDDVPVKLVWPASDPAVVNVGLVEPVSDVLPASVADVVNVGEVVPVRRPAPVTAPLVVKATDTVPDAAAVAIAVADVLNVSDAVPVANTRPRNVPDVVNAGLVVPANAPVATSVADVENVTVDVPAMAPPAPDSKNQSAQIAGCKSVFVNGR